MNDLDATKILTVEDNPNDLELTIRALKQYNLANQIYTVGDGEEALHFMFGRGRYAGRDITNNPRLILLDLKLPKVDGIEVLREIKANRRTKSIPVVMLTSSAEESDIVKSYDLGINSYIVKPVDFESFMEAVAKIGFYWLLMNKQPSDY